MTEFQNVLLTIGLNESAFDISGLIQNLMNVNDSNFYSKYSELNLYGLYENYDSIQKAGYVVVAESEKSVLKRDSFGDGTVVALSGKSISDEQVRILMGLNVEIIIGLDKDVDVNEIRFMCEKFQKFFRRVSQNQRISVLLV